MITPQDVLSKFKCQFGAAPAALFRAPGRVNLIGEHTDYNDGFVLPAAIGLSCWVAAAPRSDRRLVIHTENLGHSRILGEKAEAALDGLATNGLPVWARYPFGVAWALQREGLRLTGANLHISGEVPLGAGLSSSAAIEVATGYALLSLSGQPIDRKNLALTSQRAENDFVGAQCGIMDQFISCFGEAGRALLLDCRSLARQMVGLPPEIRLVVCNTMVKHDHAASGYNDRRAECAEAVRILASQIHGVRALRDVTLAQLEAHRAVLPAVLFKRARHVITENERVLETVRVLGAGRIESVAPLMAASHASLRDDYEVSCPELDWMVEIATGQPGVHGSRMTGGGFGGCTINLVEARSVPAFVARIESHYRARAGVRPEIYVCTSAQGAEAVNLPAAENFAEDRA
jgi:galactokinase